MELTDEESYELDQDLKDFWHRKKLRKARSEKGVKYYKEGNEFYFKGQYDKALECFEKSLEIALEDGGSEYFAESEVVKCYEVLGFTWKAKGQYDKALECFERSLEISMAIALKNDGSKGSKPSEVETGMYMTIGICYYKMKKYSLALDFSKKAFSIKKTGGTAYQIAKCYEALGNKKLVLYYFIKSAEIRKNDPAIDKELLKKSVENVLRLAKELGKEKELPNWIR